MAEENQSVDVTETTDIDTFSEEFFSKPATGNVAKDQAKTDDVSTDATDSVDPEPDATDTDPADEVDPEADGTDTDPDGEEDEGADEPEDEFKPKKNRKPAKERISELTAERKAAEARAAALEQELAALRAERQNPQPKQDEQPAPKQQTRQPEPDRPDPAAIDANGDLVYPLGEFDPQYVADVTRFTIRKEMEEQRATEAQQRAEQAEQQQLNQLQTQWAEKLTAAESDFDDLRPVIASLETQLADVEPQLGTYLAQTIMQMDVGPQVLYYLANHPDEANDIVASGPVGATLKLGKLEAKVETALAKRRDPEGKKQATPVRQTKAPEPPAVTRGRAGLPSVRPDTNDLDAFEQVFFKKKK